MDDLILRPFQQNLEWKSRLRSKRSWPQAVLEFGTTRLAGQRLHHRATGTPVSVRWLDID